MIARMAAIDPRRTRRQRAMRWDPKFNLMEQARHLSKAALEVLHETMLSSQSKPSERIAAASIILDRGWGRTPQSIQLDVNQRPVEVTALSTKELEILASGGTLPRLVAVDGEVIGQERPRP